VRQSLCTAADDLGLAYQLVDARLGQDRDINFIAGGDLFLDVANIGVLDLQFIAGGRLESRS